LLLIFLIENSGGAAGLVHILGAWLVLARLSHAYGLSSAAANFRFRAFGAVSTFLILLISAIYLLVQAV